MESEEEVRSADTIVSMAVEEADPFPPTAPLLQEPQEAEVAKLCCSFCSRLAVDVDVLIPAPTGSAAICETCVSECANMVQKEQLRLVRENRTLVAERDAALAKLGKVQELIAAIQK